MPRRGGDRARGMALIWALLLTGALMLLSVSFLAVSSASRQRAVRQIEEITTEELADAAKAEILAKLARGASNKELAREFDLAESTVKIHVQNILRKLNLHSRVQAAVYAVEQGIIEKLQ